ncbi:MAG: HEAT repeat domain-containing protein [Promethearchaeota archaeon]
MPIIKIERFWPKEIKVKAEKLTKFLEKMDFEHAKEYLGELLDILKDPTKDGRSRVSICFIIEQLVHIDPFIDMMVDTLMEVLKDEKDSHVREFSVWALGRIVEESRSLDLIKLTMPIFVKFCNDQSEQVKNFAMDFKSRLDDFIEEKKDLDQKIKENLRKLSGLVESRIDDMIERANKLAKEALELDYKAAFERRKEMEEKIREFKEINAVSEDEILSYEQQLIDEVPAFKGEARPIIQHWRELRGEKEALIRRVHCILRIQGKIYRIITHIKSRSDGKIDIKALKEETEYSDQEIIEILKKLVDEEIIPNFMLDQLDKGLIDTEKQELSEMTEGNNSGSKNGKSGGITDNLIKSEENLAKTKKQEKNDKK